MSATSLPATRSDLVSVSGATGAVGLVPAALRAGTDDTFRPFRVDFPEEALDDLRQRLAATY